MSTISFDNSLFDDLYILDLANNHQGDLAHALEIIKRLGQIVRNRGVRAAIKFQFRQLNSFIHPDHRVNSSAQHINRFLSTELTRGDFERLHNAVRDEGLLSMCTPFDEESVDIIQEMGFDFLKIASCSANDWPLLEHAASSGMPIVISTGGMELDSIDQVVSFFEHKGVNHAIMYCVSIYPIPDDEFNLNQINILKRRYPRSIIGWSTHEDPNNLSAGQIAIAKGAKLLERHIGLESGSYKLNAYSSNPEQVDAWIDSCEYAKKLCGSEQTRKIPDAEKKSIDSLRRGVFAKKNLKKGQTVSRDDVYFAMPYVDGQLDSARWREGITIQSGVKANEPLTISRLDLPTNSKNQGLKKAIHQVKALLNLSCVPLNSDFELEFSHHYGIDEFNTTGTTIINCINRDYCKKILIQLPGQKHPSHFHKRKEETFQVLYGELITEIDGHRRVLLPGETALIQPGVWHSFESKTGAVFEEISTTHYDNDSVYRDKNINKLERKERKSVVQHWGRFEI